MVPLRQSPQRACHSQLDTTLIRGKNYGACWNCRLRKKGKCKEPSPTGDCVACRRLNLKCLRGYGQLVPRELRTRVIMDQMKDWNIHPVNRRRETPFALDLTPVATSSMSAAGPSITYQIPPTIIQRSLTPTQSFPSTAAGQPLAAESSYLNVFPPFTRERSGSASPSCSTVTTGSDNSLGMEIATVGAFSPLEPWEFPDNVPSSRQCDPFLLPNPLSPGHSEMGSTVRAHQAAVDNSFLWARDDNPNTLPAFVYDMAILGGGAHSVPDGPIEFPVPLAPEAMLPGQNQLWNNLSLAAASQTGNSSGGPSTVPGFHADNERADDATFAEVGQARPTLNPPTTFSPLGQSVRRIPWAEMVQTNGGVRPCASDPQRSIISEYQPVPRPESQVLSQTTPMLQEPQLYATPHGSRPYQTLYEQPLGWVGQRVKPSGFPGSLVPSNSNFAARGPDQDIGRWGREIVANRMRYQAWLNAPIGQSAPDPSFTSSAFVEPSAVGWSGHVETNSAMLRPGGGLLVQIAGTEAQGPVQTGRGTLPDDLLSVQAREAQYGQLPHPSNLHPQSQGLDNPEGAYSEDVLIPAYGQHSHIRGMGEAGLSVESTDAFGCAEPASTI